MDDVAQAIVDGGMLMRKAADRILELEARLNATKREELALHQILVFTHEFLKENPKWVDIANDTGGLGLCADASSEMHQFFEAKNVSSRTTWMNLADKSKCRISPHRLYPDLNLDEPGSEHCVVLVDEKHIVDLTAQQYGEHMPFPFIWTLKLA